MMTVHESTTVLRWMVLSCMENPGKKPPMWLHKYHEKRDEIFERNSSWKRSRRRVRPLLTGEAARAAIATADACTRSRFEDRKVKLSEIIG